MKTTKEPHIIQGLPIRGSYHAVGNSVLDPNGRVVAIVPTTSGLDLEASEAMARILAASWDALRELRRIDYLVNGSDSFVTIHKGEATHNAIREVLDRVVNRD